MESTSGPEWLAAAIGIVVVLAAVAFALWRGEQARARGAEPLTRSRTTRAYVCFLASGAAMVALVPLGYFIQSLPAQSQQGASAALGFFGGVPTAIVFLAAIFHALMVWRVALIRILLLASLTLGVLDRKSTRLNSSHLKLSRMPSSA